jgi:hypothetical protein
VQKAALVETQQPATASVAANQNPPSKALSSFRESFISSGKQGGGATVLKEGRDTVTRENCSTSLNINNLGKAAGLHPALFCGWGLAKLSLPIIGHSCAYVKFS